MHRKGFRQFFLAWSTHNPYGNWPDSGAEHTFLIHYALYLRIPSYQGTKLGKCNVSIKMEYSLGHLINARVQGCLLYGFILVLHAYAAWTLETYRKKKHVRWKKKMSKPNKFAPRYPSFYPLWDSDVMAHRMLRPANICKNHAVENAQKLVKIQELDDKTFIWERITSVYRTQDDQVPVTEGRGERRCGCSISTCTHTAQRERQIHNCNMKTKNGQHMDTKHQHPLISINFQTPTSRFSSRIL